MQGHNEWLRVESSKEDQDESPPRKTSPTHLPKKLDNFTRKVYIIMESTFPTSNFMYFHKFFLFYNTKRHSGCWLILYINCASVLPLLSGSLGMQYSFPYSGHVHFK